MVTRISQQTENPKTKENNSIFGKSIVNKQIISKIDGRELSSWLKLSIHGHQQIDHISRGHSLVFSGNT